MRKIVILTADELRHDYFKLKFALEKDIHVLKTYCDITNKKYDLDNLDYSNIQNIHFCSRKQVEEDFFREFTSSAKDLSNSEYIKRGSINTEKYINEICELNPDFIVAYGCCIIKPKLIELFKNRIINVHLGLSPYYFGSGTNFHPFVNQELSAVGATFMYMDAGIDTGNIIHQIRADIDTCDSIHQVGNRLIKKMTNVFIRLVKNFEKVKDIKQLSHEGGITYKNKDCTPQSVEEAYKNIKNNLCAKYLKNKDNLDSEFPISQQDFLC